VIADTISPFMGKRTPFDDAVLGVRPGFQKRPKERRIEEFEDRILHDANPLPRENKLEGSKKRKGVGICKKGLNAR